MKIQCPCGAKIAFDVKPEMALEPVRFICPTCGLDSSEMVNQLILQELSAAAAETAPIPRPTKPSVRVVAMTPEQISAATDRVKVYPGDKARAAAGAAQASQFCAKHPGRRPVSRCVVCQKPICPKCMETFGYVCSAHCQNKAELQGIEVPVYDAQRNVVQQRYWRKMSRIAAAAATLVIVLIAGWCWFAFFATRPGVAYSVRFERPALSGQSVLSGENQLVFLHGDTLARHDIKARRQIWSRELIDSQKAAEAAADYLKNMKTANARAAAQWGESGTKLPSQDKLARSIEDQAAAELKLHVNGQNIWVSTPEKLVRYDWSTGNPAQEIPIENESGRVVTRGNELMVFGTGLLGEETVTRISLVSGETHSEQVRGTVVSQTPETGNKTNAAAAKPLDPAKVAADVQRMSYEQKIALPATLAVQRNQQQALDQMKEDDEGKPPAATPFVPRKNSETTSIIPTRNGVIQFSSTLLEYKTAARKAMKDPPKESALSGNVSVLDTVDVANEVFNDIQRQRGGDVVEENVSRYLVTLRSPDVQGAQVWRGEVVGPPKLFALNTVTVLAAGKTLIVFDKLNKKLWQSTLAFNIEAEMDLFGEDDPGAGQGPCAEHGDTLYVFDEGLLSAFNLATGVARWRLPSVGVAALFFDDEGMVYINSTSANYENLKYSRQIDVSQKIDPVIVKIDAKTGKTLWTAEPGGVINHLSGKFIYTLESLTMEDEADENPEKKSGLEARPFIRIRRLDPKNGTILWTYFDQHGPLDVRFDKNSIQVVFKNEVQVLRFLSF